MVTLVKSPQEMESFAETFVHEYFLKATSHTPQAPSVFCLHGDLGSGKTTFVQGVGKALGVEGILASPTFVLEKVYKLTGQPFEHLIHLDAYRLSGGDELLHLGFEEMLRNPGSLVFIEWAENVADVLPKDCSDIHFRFVDENTREVEI